ncbi:MAG: hypothetical protein C3F11_16000 [Methylocystaceae bacterium]|nr:MAG: hypothetical protein C3F11_16000 [Methylocystaceae bacterium]
MDAGSASETRQNNDLESFRVSVKHEKGPPPPSPTPRWMLLRPSRDDSFMTPAEKTSPKRRRCVSKGTTASNVRCPIDATVRSTPAVKEASMRRTSYERAKNFIDKVAVSNRFEIYASELALRHAASADVKSFAEQMIDDHRKTGEEFAAVLEKAAIEPPIDALDLAYTGKFIQLRAFGVMGDVDSDFDRSYMLQQLEAHEDAVAVFSDYATSGETPELKAFAMKTLPTLEHHLHMARALNSKMTH